MRDRIGQVEANGEQRYKKRGCKCDYYENHGLAYALCEIEDNIISATIRVPHPGANTSLHSGYRRLTSGTDRILTTAPQNHAAQRHNILLILRHENRRHGNCIQA